MKAAVFHAPGQKLSIETLPDPTPGAGQVVLSIARCGICGSDIHMTETHGVLAAGSVLGHEFAGEIVALGSGVQNLKIGDCITALPLANCGKCEACLRGEAKWCEQFLFRAGGYAEYALADAASCLKLPDSLTLADGALVEPMAVARHAVQLSELKAGDDVLVLGAGPIGLATIYWAKRFGAGRVIACAATRRHEALALAMGVDHFVVNDSEAVPTITAQLGKLPQVIVECVGLPGMIVRCIELCRPRGTIAVAGACVAMDQFMPLLPALKELRMVFPILYTLQDFQASIDAMDAGGIEVRAMITDTVGLGGFADMFESLRSRTQQCKVMLAPQINR
jgi:(R,R)-butanediol dehydrogenase/meso-butanediol dehydrogenase/diacetyl reductase